MSSPVALIMAALVFGAVGAAIGFYLRALLAKTQKDSAELEIQKMLLGAKEKAQTIVAEGEKNASARLKEAEKEAREKEEFVKKAELRILERESLVDKRQLDLDKEVEEVRGRIKAVEEIKQKIAEKEKTIDQKISEVAHMSEEEAQAKLLTRIEKEHDADLMMRVQKLELAGKEKYDEKAKQILITAIHRFGNAVPADAMTTTIAIPNEEIKGKIIGKEGRNIKAFERAAGVDVIVDDTPGAITISCFDPVRRQVARIALENLIIDGRIQPVKIEEMVQKAQEEINRIIKEKGEQAAFDTGVLNLDPRILMILGRLHFRTSYGQNVLQHSIEMAHIAGMIAAEVGADVAIAKAGALVHDLGKALDHEVQGTHVEIGRRVLQKFGCDERIIQAMQAHHEEYPYETTESIIVQVADAISGGRTGARRDSVEQYLKRLGELEDIAHSFPGVEKAYAIQAGREVRVFVKPEEVSDFEARSMARGIADRIEQDLKYPGEIRIAVIRESRAIEFAR